MPWFGGEMDDPQARDAADQPVEHLGGVVAAAVVDGDDLELGIVDRRGGAQRLLGIVALVVAGHEDEIGGQWLDRRRIALGAAADLARDDSRRSAPPAIQYHAMTKG